MQDAAQLHVHCVKSRSYRCVTRFWNFDICSTGRSLATTQLHNSLIVLQCSSNSERKSRQECCIVEVHIERPFMHYCHLVSVPTDLLHKYGSRLQIQFRTSEDIGIRAKFQFYRLKYFVRSSGSGGRPAFCLSDCGTLDSPTYS